MRLSRRRHREQTGLMSVEGFAECSLAWKSGALVERLYICPDFLRDGHAELLADIQATGISPLFVSPEVMGRLAYRQHPDAWFFVVRRPGSGLETLCEPGERALYIVAEDIEKPGNLGAMVRSADAAGASAVIVSDGRTDLSNPNVVRASKGINFSLPCVQTSNPECLRWLRERNIAIVAAQPAAPVNLWETELPARMAVVFGAENEGVSPFWKESADLLLSIPMVGSVNSINVAQAATVIMYEVLRRAVLD